MILVDRSTQNIPTVGTKQSHGGNNLFPRWELCGREDEAGGGEDFAVNSVGGDNGDGALACDELTGERIDDMTAVGGSVAGGGEALAGGDVGRVFAEGEDGTVAEVDKGIGDAERGEKVAQALQCVAFEDAGEVEDKADVMNEK